MNRPLVHLLDILGVVFGIFLISISDRYGQKYPEFDLTRIVINVILLGLGVVCIRIGVYIQQMKGGTRE
jgi:hypothetical protein